MSRLVRVSEAAATKLETYCKSNQISLSHAYNEAVSKAVDLDFAKQVVIKKEEAEVVSPAPVPASSKKKKTKIFEAGEGENENGEEGKDYIEY